MELPGYVVCPSCHGALSTPRSCAVAAGVATARRGDARLLDPSAPGIEAKLRELAAWPELAREQGWYGADDEVDAALPFLNRDLGWSATSPRGATAVGFEHLLDRYISGGDRVLEIGAAKSWASQHLLPRGCEYVACDLVVDPVIGLGRGAFFEQRVGSYLRVQADGERLPFATASFDVAFCVATLHHALDLRAMVRELARVTRPGGIVAGLNKGTRAPHERPQPRAGARTRARDQRTRPYEWTYLWAFTSAGLRPLRLDYAEGAAALAKRNIAGKLLKLGRPAATLWALNAYTYAGLSLYARRR